MSEHNAEIIRRSWRNPNTPKAAVIGFGRLGRVMVPMLTSAGYNIYAIDRKGPLVDAYKEQGCYTVVSVDRYAQKHRIVQGVWLMDNESEYAGFISHGAEEKVGLIVTATSPVSITSANASDPKGAVRIIESILAARYERQKETGGSPLNIVCTEQIPYASQIVREEVLSKAALKSRDFSAWIELNIGFVDNVLDAIVPNLADSERAELCERIGRTDRLVTLAGMTIDWFWDGSDLKGQTRQIPGVSVVGNIAPYQRRYTNMFNSAQIAIGLTGQMLGYRQMNTAANDELVRSFVLSMLEDEIIPTLSSIRGFSPSTLEHYKNSTLHRISDPGLKDEITRILSNPLMKLARNEMLLSPALSAATEFGVMPRKLCFTIAALLIYAADYDLDRDQEKLVDPDQAYWEKARDRQKALRGIIEEIRAPRPGPSLVAAKEKLAAFLSSHEECCLNPSNYWEGEILKQVIQDVVSIARSKDRNNTIKSLLEEGRKPTIIRPSGIVSC